MNRNRLLREESLRVHMDEEDAVARLSEQLFHYVKENIDRELIVVCIGTDRSTGDALGPLVGSILEQAHLQYFQIYGTLEHPVHAVNLVERIEHIKHQHPDAFILAIDACLGRSTNIGTITLASGPIQPGAAVKKQLPAIGDVHIAGVVNVGGMMEYIVLQNTRLYTVVKMAERIANVIMKTDATLKSTYYTPSLFHFLKNKKVRSKNAL